MPPLSPTPPLILLEGTYWTERQECTSLWNSQCLVDDRYRRHLSVNAFVAAADTNVKWIRDFGSILLKVLIVIYSPSSCIPRCCNWGGYVYDVTHTDSMLTILFSFPSGSRRIPFAAPLWCTLSRLVRFFPILFFSYVTIAQDYRCTVTSWECSSHTESETHLVASTTERARPGVGGDDESERGTVVFVFDSRASTPPQAHFTYSSRGCELAESVPSPH